MRATLKTTLLPSRSCSVPVLDASCCAGPDARSGAMPAVAAGGAGARRGARSRCTALALAGLAVAGICGQPREAAAALAEQPGQAVGLAIQGALYACSVTSIVGNSVNIATRNPQRGWLYSGFICGFTNTVVSPVMLIFFSDAEPTPYGLAAGAVHGVLGVTNLALAIYNGVLWHRAQVAGKEPPKVSLVPMVGRDQLGASVVGLSLRMVRF